MNTKTFESNPFAIAWKRKLARLHPVELSGEDEATKRFWSEKISMRNDPNVARINGNHYIIGGGKGATKGMSGAKHTIQFDDGRVVETDDLWHQGEIPVDFRQVLQDNAKFI